MPARTQHPLTLIAFMLGLVLILPGCSMAQVTAQPLQASQSTSAGLSDQTRWTPTIQSIVHEAYETIHSNPELGNEEFETQRYLAGKLREAGIERFIDSERAPTAVLAVLDSGRPGPTLALRAEMDARETTENPANMPRSAIDGVMHNCGHDVHAAMLLGAAIWLHDNPQTWTGRILVIFQPAEEIRGGADDIVDEAILDAFSVDAIIAQHVVSGMPVGTVSISPGPHLAGSNYFTLKVMGDGSHAAMPSEGGDTVVAAAKLVSGLAELPARRLDVIERPAIISPTAIMSNTQSSNVIPGEVEVRGTIRAFEDLDQAPEGGQSIEELVRSYVDGASAALGVEYELEIRKGSPPTVNDPELYKALVPSLQRQWHGEVRTDDYKGMFSEDFSYYTAVVPALYFGLGVSRDGRGGASVHSPDFNIHTDALREGTQLLVSMVQLYSGFCGENTANPLCGELQN